MEYLQHRGKYAPPAEAPRPGIVLLDLNMPKKDGRGRYRQKLEHWSKPPEPGKAPSGYYEPIERTGGSVIDHTQLASLREIQEPGEPAFVIEVIDLFLNETENHLRACVKP